MADPKSFLIPIDLNGYQLLNASFQSLAAAPSSPALGRYYLDTSGTKPILKFYDGTAWTDVGAVLSVNSKTGTVVLTQDDVGDGTTYKRSHNDLTDALLALINGALQRSGGTMTGAIAMGSNKITGLANGTAATDAAAFGQIPVAETSTPAMDGTAAVGSSTKWAKGDHVHPTDTSRMAANLKGAAGGVAELDSNGKVPSSQLPSYVDDVIEGYYYNSKFYSDSAHTTEITGESGKIYIDLTTEKTYRWGGSSYAEISASLALGETSTTAYRGDRGKTAYDHSQVTSGNPHNVSKSDVGLGSVDNTSDATKKTNFTGSIASGNTGFVTGGDAHTAISQTRGMIAGTETTSVASKAYAVGDYLIHNNTLYRVTLSIAQGDTISDDVSTGNITEVELGAEIKRVENELKVTVVNGTISTSGTSVTVNVTVPSGLTMNVLNAYALQGGAIVLTDVEIGSSSVKFTIAQPASAEIKCYVAYILA